MARGCAALVAATLPWLVLPFSFPDPVMADGPATVTISPTDPPTSSSVDVRLYEYFTSGVGWVLQRNEILGNVIEIEHHFDISNLPTITEFDETYSYDSLGGDYTFRWIRHFEYAGQTYDSVVELPFTVPLTEPVASIPALDTWAKLAGAASLGLVLALAAGRRRQTAALGKT